MIVLFSWGEIDMNHIYLGGADRPDGEQRRDLQITGGSPQICY